jgi:hypothetical protein
VGDIGKVEGIKINKGAIFALKIPMPYFKNFTNLFKKKSIAE